MRQKILFLLLAQSMVATNIVGTKFLTPHFSVLFLITARFFLAGLILFLFFLATPSQRKNAKLVWELDKKAWLFVFAQAICAGVLFNFMMVWGLNYTNANMAGIIASTLPAMIAILSWIFLKDALTTQKWCCILFATLGLVVVNLDKLKGGLLHASLLGDLIILLGMLPEAGYYVLSRLHPLKLRVFLLSAFMNGINAIILLPILFWQSHGQLPALPIECIGVIGLTSLCSGMFYVFWSLGSKSVESSMAALSTAVMPMMVIIISWATMGERVGTLQMLGMVFVVMSIVMCVY